MLECIFDFLFLRKISISWRNTKWTERPETPTFVEDCKTLNSFRNWRYRGTVVQRVWRSTRRCTGGTCQWASPPRPSSSSSSRHRTARPRPGGIISLSIQKLAEKAKSPPCQPRLSQGPLCPPWQPQAVREQIRHSLPAPGCHRVIKVHLDSPRLSKWAKHPF